MTVSARLLVRLMLRLHLSTAILAENMTVRLGCTSTELDPNTGGFISEDLIGFEAGDNNLYRSVGNSPTNANNPSGLIIDTALDVGFIAYDLYKIAKDNIFGNCDNLGENLLALGADIGGALIPFATGGGAAIRAGKAANQAEICPQ